MHDSEPTPFSPPEASARAPRLRALPSADEVRAAPSSEAAERHVVACCLLDQGTTLARCLREKISVDSFHHGVPRLIFQILVDLQRSGKPISVEVLSQELVERKLMDAIGGGLGLMQVLEGVPTTAHAGYFIELVREKWILRKLLAAAQELQEGVHNFDGNLADFVSKHALKLQRAADFVLRCKRPAAGEEALAAREALSEILAGKVDKSRQLSLGTPYLDQTLLPFDVKNEDWFVVVAGPPSGGKSSEMRQIVGVNCLAGKRCAVFLLETGKRRWLWALAAMLAHVNLRDILEHPERVLPEHLKRFRQWEEIVMSWVGERLWIFDDQYFVEDIERTVRELDRTLREQELAAGVPAEQACGLHFFVGDYLQLMGTREKIRIREEQVAYLSRTIKKCAKSLNLTAIIGAQLNRKSRDEERRPRLSDLRESGAIEQDADAVLFVHTPTTDKAGATQTGERTIHEVEFIQGKRRNGPANLAVDMLFHKTQTRFEDAARKGDPRPGAPKPATGYKRPGGAA